MQQFPVFQGLHGSQNVARSEIVTPKAIAQETSAAPVVDERPPVVNLHEVADNEELLKELDACGVSFNSFTFHSTTHCMHRF